MKSAFFNSMVEFFANAIPSILPSIETTLLLISLSLPCSTMRSSVPVASDTEGCIHIGCLFEGDGTVHE